LHYSLLLQHRSFHFWSPTSIEYRSDSENVSEDLLWIGDCAAYCINRLLSGSDVLPPDMLDDYGSYMFAITRKYRATRPLQDFSAGKQPASVPYQ